MGSLKNNNNRNKQTNKQNQKKNRGFVKKKNEKYPYKVTESSFVGVLEINFNA